MNRASLGAQIRSFPPSTRLVLSSLAHRPLDDGHHRCISTHDALPNRDDDSGELGNRQKRKYCVENTLLAGSIISPLHIQMSSRLLSRSAITLLSRSCTSSSLNPIYCVPQLFTQRVFAATTASRFSNISSHFSSTSMAGTRKDSDNFNISKLFDVKGKVCLVTGGGSGTF